MKRPPLVLVFVAILMIALGQTAGAVMSQASQGTARLARARILANAPAQWWLVGIAYALSAAVILAVIVAVAAVGPYRRTCLQDLLAIARPVLPRRAT